MNKITNNFLLAGDEFAPGMHLRQSRFTYMLPHHLRNVKKELKNKKNQVIQDTFIKTR